MKRSAGAVAPSTALARAMAAVVGATGVVSFLLQDLPFAIATIVVVGITCFVWLAVSRTAGLTRGMVLLAIAVVVVSGRTAILMTPSPPP